MEKWKHPKTITGDAVTGESYLRRDKINNLFWSLIEKGLDILFVAPRRVGKTSIMKDLEENAPEQYYCIYKDVEGAMNANQFYQRIFEMLINRLSKVKRVKTLAKKWAKKYEIQEVGVDGVKIGRTPDNYKNEVFSLLNQVASQGINIILFVDEFVEVILNLRNAEKTEEAVALLHELREIRHNKELSNIIFVYAGSIGLHYVVNEIGRPKLINDIEPLKVEALTKPEAKQLIRQLTVVATIKYTEDHEDYLIRKVEHLLPYFIQLMVQEIDIIAYKSDQFEITEDIIDQAFTNVTKNTANFDDWIKRLKQYIGNNYKFVNHVLTCCAHKGKITTQEIFDIANENGEQETWKDLLDELERDGYLFEINGYYQFVSPFIKSFWLHKYPILPC